MHLHTTITSRTLMRMRWLPLACLALLGACASQERYRYASVPLPISTPGLRVAYEAVRMGPTGGLNDWQQRRRDDIIETLRVSVENKLPAPLRAAGIAALVHSTKPPELIDWNHPSFAAAGDDWLSLRVRPVSMTQNCVNAGASCAYQLRVSLTLMGPLGQGGVLWSIEIAEPTMVSAFVYQARYDELAEHMARAVLQAVQPNSAAPS